MRRYTGVDRPAAIHCRRRHTGAAEWADLERICPADGETRSACGGIGPVGAAVAVCGQRGLPFFLRAKARDFFDFFLFLVFFGLGLVFSMHALRCMYAYVCVCIHVCVGVCMYVCIHVCVGGCRSAEIN